MARAQAVSPRPRAGRTSWRLEVWRVVLVLGLICLGILGYVWQHIQVLRLGYALEELRARRATLLQEQKTLTIELARLTALNRIEAVARDRLGMETARPGQVIVLPEPR
jgi:cell division protein FtsL